MGKPGENSPGFSNVTNLRDLSLLLCRNKVYLSQDEGVTNNLIWADNDQRVLFSISADYDEDTLIKIAENIQAKN